MSTQGLHPHRIKTKSKNVTQLNYRRSRFSEHGIRQVNCRPLLKNRPITSVLSSLRFNQTKTCSTPSVPNRVVCKGKVPTCQSRASPCKQKTVLTAKSCNMLCSLQTKSTNFSTLAAWITALKLNPSLCKGSATTVGSTVSAAQLTFRT